MVSRVGGVLAAAVVALGLLAAGPAQPASAAGNGLWSIEPAPVPGQPQRQNITYLLVPGDTLRDAVTLFNQTRQPLPLLLYPADAINAQGGGFTLQTPNKPRRYVGKWTQVSDQEFTLPPRSMATVPIYVNVPGNTPPGDYAGGVVMRPVNPAVQKRGNLSFGIYQAVGTPIFIRIKGPLRPGLAVTHVAVHPDTTISGLFGGPTSGTVSYTFKNTGNEILNPRSYLKVSPLAGGATTFHPQNFPSILPGNSVTITRHVSSIEPVLRLTGNVTMKPTRPFEPVVTGSASAWVIPWLLIAVLVLLAVLYYLRRRRRKGKAPPITAPPPGAGSTPGDGDTAAVGAGTEK